MPYLSLDPQCPRMAASGCPFLLHPSHWGKGDHNQGAWSSSGEMSPQLLYNRADQRAEDQTHGWSMSTCCSHPPSRAPASCQSWCGYGVGVGTRTSAVGGRATRLDGAGPDYPLSILSWPKVTSCPPINSSCESKGSYLGPHSRCGWATIDSSLPQCGFFSSSRRPCPIPPLQALLARRNVLWKSSQLVASVAKTPKS